MFEIPTLTSFIGLLVLLSVGAIVMWLKEIGAREERERKDQMLKSERMMEEPKEKRKNGGRICWQKCQRSVESYIIGRKLPR